MNHRSSSPSLISGSSISFQTILVLLCISVLLRYLVSIHPHSGQGKAPMFGDYEAQRHWMEITINTDIKQWYFNTTDNDLLYWGLDYPPLTAYLSWISYTSRGEFIEPESMKLFTSRGYDTASSKLFMRMTVIVSDLFIWIPSVYLFVETIFNQKQQQSPSSSSSNIMKKIYTFLFISLHPALLLIDHGHFQYNGISLGLALFAITFILRDQDLLASFFFVLSLNYKQIIKSIIKIGLIGVTVIITFVLQEDYMKIK
eukprot:gene2878-3578_t